MKLDKLYPWNWFKHEESQGDNAQIPVRRGDSSCDSKKIAIQ